MKSLLGLSFRPEVQDEVSQAQAIIDHWIANLHHPSVDELMTLSELLKKAAKSAVNLDGKYKASLARIQLLEKSLTCLQQETTENRDELVALRAENESLKSQIVALKEELKEFRQKFTPIEAKSIASAAERRFVDFLLDQSPGLTKTERKSYKLVEHIIFDYDNDDLSPDLRTAWEAHRKVWNSSLFKNIFSRLSYGRGTIFHEEDRDPRKYVDLSRAYLENVFDDVGCRPKEKQALLALHMYTVTSVESSCLGDTGSV